MTGQRKPLAFEDHRVREAHTQLALQGMTTCCDGIEAMVDRIQFLEEFCAAKTETIVSKDMEIARLNEQVHALLGAIEEGAVEISEGQWVCAVCEGEGEQPDMIEHEGDCVYEAVRNVVPKP